jgi:3-hydroxyisobutyrate dehydrogenase-like beta-hydroxyacid dehydrogenase
MARNLIELGHNVTLFNRTRVKALELASAGAQVASTVAEAVKEAQVALTMLSDDAAEEELTFGPDGLLAHLPAGAIHLCMSTIGVACSRKLASAHGEKGQGYVAAPVFGRPGAAASRHLWIIAAGPDAQVNRGRTIFDALGRGLTRVGEVPELAHALKLGGSMLTVTMVEGLSEVLAFGEKAGLASAEYLRLLNTAIFKSPLLDAYGGLMIRHTYEPADLSLEMAAEDMQRVLEASNGTAAAMPMAALLQGRLQTALERSLGGLDLSALSRASRIDAGLEKAPEGAPGTVSPKAAQGNGVQEPAVIAAPMKAPPLPVKAAVPERTPAPPEREIVPVAVILSAMENPSGQVPGAPKDAPKPAMPPLQPDSRYSFPAVEGDQHLTLDLKRTSHFEAIGGQVWAWSQGKRFGTSWGSLAEVELAFRHTFFLRIQRNLLLQPETVQSIKPLFGGRSRVTVPGEVQLELGRDATTRLKDILGL